MNIKDVSEGKSFNRSIGKTMAYLGTNGDNTKAHKNPNLKRYLRAKSHHNNLLMAKYLPYTQRDVATFGNMPTKNSKTIEKFTNKIMNKHQRRHVKLHQFVLMPSDKDNINPIDPDSVIRFKKYITNFVNLGIEGKWYKHKGKYHYKSDKKTRFLWFADIQPDSHTHSKIHAHIVVINDDTLTDKGMNPRTYHIQHLRWAVNQVSKQLGFSKAPVTQKQHRPSKVETKIIKASQGIRNNIGITSRKKLIKYLATNGIKAKFRKRKNKPNLNGWKFKVKGHAYIKASRLSHAVGGDFLASSGIATILSDNRKKKGAERANEKEKEAKKQHAKHLKLVHQQYAFNQQNKRLAKQLFKAYKNFKTANSLYMGMEDTSGMQDWINKNAHLKGLENRALKEHRFSRVQLKEIEHRRFTINKPTTQHSKSSNNKQKSHVNINKNNKIKDNKNKHAIKSQNKPYKSKQKVSSANSKKDKQNNVEINPVYSDSEPTFDISKGDDPISTVSDTMSYLSDNHARQDFGTEIDMRNRVHVHNNSVPKASRLNRYDINDRTNFIRNQYNLSDKDGSTIDEYWDQPNKPHHFIHKIGKVLSEAKSWLKNKGIKFISWLNFNTQPTSRSINPPKKESDAEQQRAFNRNRLKRLQHQNHPSDWIP